MYADFIYPEYEVVRNYQRCIACRACERQCANEVHRYDADEQMMTADDAKCVNCHRCLSLCPTRALKIVRTDHTFKENANWTKDNIQNVYRQAATELGVCYNTGEGGLHEDFYRYGPNTIVQVASGRFGVHSEYLNAGAAVEIKMGQGAKPGIGGHLPGAKIVGDVARTRMVPEGADAISPAPHHDIYSIEDLRQLVNSLKEATHYEKPIIVKIAAVHNVAAIASGIARSGADIIAIDGFRGGTGAAPTRIRDNVGIPIELALAAVDSRLRAEGIRGDVSLVVGGSIRSSADVVKAVALGADAVYIATSALLALGCHLCRTCQLGRCNWGIATQRPDLVKRLNPDLGAARLVNLVTAWQHEIKEMMGGMGINSIEALKGNRLMLRGVGMTEKELEILGISHAGE